MRYLIALVLMLAAPFAAAQNVNCTVSCSLVTDAFAPPPDPQPTICTLSDGATPVVSSSVAGPAGAVYCSFTTTFAEGRAVSLTATATYPAGTSAASAPPLVFTSTAGPPPSTITIGETAVMPNADGSNANLLSAQSATLNETATMVSLSFYVTTAAGNLRLGVYDATGPNGGPGAKKAETSSFAPIAGWNTRNVMTQVALAPGVYWLAFIPSSNSLLFPKSDTPGADARYYGRAFGPLPATFSTNPNSTTSHWSLYATLNVGGSPPLNAPTGLRVVP